MDGLADPGPVEISGIPWSLLGTDTVIPRPLRSGWVESTLKSFEQVSLVDAFARKNLNPWQGFTFEIFKSQFLLLVMVNDVVVKAYPVALSGNPVGDKMSQGDKKTPEGRYQVLKHVSPSYGLSFYVCYPNRADALRAFLSDQLSYGEFKRIELALQRSNPPPRGTPLGSQILIHTTRAAIDSCATCVNWSLGCIVMEPEDLAELLALVPWRTPIELTIHPVDFDPDEALFAFGGERSPAD
jgi:murein L,D-transpeptidase YafK